MSALHHRPNLDDIRTAYDSDRSYYSKRQRSYFDSQSSSSDRSYHTQPTDYSCSPPKTWKQPRFAYGSSHSKTHSTSNSIAHPRSTPTSRFFPDQDLVESPRASVETYASTIPSEEDLSSLPTDYAVPAYCASPDTPSATPTTPSAFSELFPSHRRLTLRHDASTVDGNMNLRADTEVVMQNGRTCNLTLFHLRMHDLQNREFSLRRYCRDSGREVCHSSRKPERPASSKRPSFQRSLSNAINSMRSRSDSKFGRPPKLQRNDSGYGSVYSNHDTLDRQQDHPSSVDSPPKSLRSPPGDTVRLEFSNYAQVEVRRVGSKGNQRYEYEYWGVNYAWRRVEHVENGIRSFALQLTRANCESVLAYVVPIVTSAHQLEEERFRGGWISPYSMWIADESIVHSQKDVADVVIASGLIALVDESIRFRFQSSKPARRLSIAGLPIGLEYVGPKRFIDEVLKRGASSHNVKQVSSNSRDHQDWWCDSRG